MELAEDDLAQGDGIVGPVAVVEVEVPVFDSVGQGGQVKRAAGGGAGKLSLVHTALQDSPEGQRDAARMRHFQARIAAPPGYLVGGTGFEPVTSSVSRKRSPPEPTAPSIRAWNDLFPSQEVTHQAIPL